jgi:dUTP pyrophosphatase
MLEIQIQKIFHDSLLPELKTNGSAGYDLFAYCPEGIKLDKGEHKLIPTGIKIALPEGYDAEIRPRSGLANKQLIFIPNSPGTIDNDYRGEILVGVINFGKNDFLIEHNMRIAQLIIRKTYIAEFKVVDSLENTIRGEGGFGSTGLK